MLQKYEKPRENGNLLPVFREHFKTTSKIVKDKAIVWACTQRLPNRFLSSAKIVQPAGGAKFF